MTNNGSLDAKTRELIAVGASIAANCLPCLRYHFAEARKLGCTLEDIQETIELAKLVKERPTEDISKLTSELMQRERDSVRISQNLQ